MVGRLCDSGCVLRLASDPGGISETENPLKNSMWQLIFIMIGAILWDYATGWIGWSVDFAIPLAVLLNGVTMQILARAYKMEVSEYLFI